MSTNFSRSRARLGRLGPSLLSVAVLTALLTGCTVTDFPRLPGSDPQPPPAPATETDVRRSGGQLMSGADVRSILGKARYRWEGVGGAGGNAITTPDGRIRIIWESGAVNGRIRFNETGYCSRFERVRGGAEDCYRLYRVGPGQYEVFRLDGSRSGRIQITG